MFGCDLLHGEHIKKSRSVGKILAIIFYTFINLFDKGKRSFSFSLVNNFFHILLCIGGYPYE